MGSLPHWVKYKPHPHSNLVSYENLKYHMDKISGIIAPNCLPGDIKYLILNKKVDNDIYRNQGKVTRRTVESVLKRGHTDCEIFIYLNALQAITKKELTPNGKVRWKNIYFCKYKTENFKIDLDNIPKCETIQDVIDLLTKREVELPKIIIKTSKNSFHLIFLGKLGDSSYDRRLYLAKKIAGIPQDVTNHHLLKEKMKEAGVDYGHLKTNIWEYNTRLPFSLNYNGSDHSICEVWYNESYKNLELVKIPEVNTDPENTIDPKTRKLISDRTEFLLERFRHLFSEEDAEFYSTLLGEGWTGLTKGSERILQTYWEGRTKYGQYTISRKLKKLRELGYLVIVKDYKRSSKTQKGEATTYTAGPALKELMDIFYQRPKAYKNYDIMLPYQDGRTMEHIMADVRCMVEKGHSDDEIVEFIMNKQYQRPDGRQIRSRKSIYSLCCKWKNKRKSEVSLTLPAKMS